MTNFLLLFLAIALGPALILGLLRKVKARLQNRIGAPIWQPLFDLIKLLKKEETVSDTTTWMFRFSAALSVVCTIYLAAISPWISGKPTFGSADLFMFLYMLAALRFFHLLAALDAASPFGAFAASREAMLSFLTEPAATLSLVSLGVAAQSSDLNSIFALPGQMSGHAYSALWLLSGTALLMASLVELSRMPVDDPTTHLELTMVHEALNLEASGKNLALFEYAHALKLMILFGLSAQCFLHVWPAAARLDTNMATLCGGAALVAVALVVAVFESLAVKLNWRKTPEFIAYALTFALIGSLISAGIKSL